MKRGFLRGSENDSKNSRPPASKQGVDASQAAANPADKPQESFKIPLIPDYDDVPDKRRTFAGNIVTIPLPLLLFIPVLRKRLKRFPDFLPPTNLSSESTIALTMRRVLERGCSL